MRRIFSLALLMLVMLFAEIGLAEQWLVDRMADTVQWKLTGQRLHYSLGASKLEVVRMPLRAGAAAVLRLSCDLEKRTWIGIQWSGGPLVGRPERLSFGLHGDTSGQVLVARIEDAAGRFYEVPLGAISFEGWQEIDVPMEPARWIPVCRRGDPEVAVRWPVALRELRVVKSNAKTVTPTIAFSELRAVGQPAPTDRVKIRLSCPAPANVFYQDEPVRLEAQIENPLTEAVAGQLEAVACDWLGREERHPLGTLRIAAAQTHQAVYGVPLKRLGSYTVWLRLVSESGVAEARQRVAVSQRRPLATPDPRSPMGMGLYLPRFRDDIQLDLALTLAREAGVKWTRGDLSVARCQPEPGQWAWDTIRWQPTSHGHAVDLAPHLRLRVASSDSLNRPCVTGELTLALRLRLATLDYPDRWRTLLSKGEGGGRQWYLFWDVKTRRLGLSLGDGKTRWTDCVAAKADWEPGRWYEILVSHRRSDRSVQWWIDGRKAGTGKAAFAETLVANDAPMTVGGGLKGTLDDLAIYDRCLEPGDAATARPVAHWTFDEGQGLVAVDRSGNKNSLSAEPWRYDSIFAKTRNAGISTYCVVMGTPRWMAARPTEGQERPELMMPRLDDWSAALAKMVARQKPAGIRTWEIWNEPNILSFWSPEPNPDEYAQVLIASYKAIKSVDPEATVLGCALAGPNGPRYRKPYEFVEEVLKRGGGRAMDAIAIHPYRQPRTPEESGYLDDLRAISDLTARYGRRLPMWITEIGWPTDSAGSSESRSAQMLVRAYVLALAQGVQNIAWYDYRDDGTDPSYNEHHFGILYHDLTPKPSYFAFRTMATELAGLRFERELPAGEGVSAFLFGDGRRRIAVAWSHRGEKSLAFQLGDRHSCEVLDLMGNARKVRVVDGAWLTTVDESPIFLRDVPTSLAVVRPIETSPPVLKVLRGEAATLTVTLRNPFSTALCLTWANQQVQLPPNGQRQITITRPAEQWSAGTLEPWRSDRGIAIAVPGQVVILNAQKEPIFRYEAETSRTVEIAEASGANATDEVTIAARFRSDGPSGTWQALATKWAGQHRNWGIFLGREKGDLSFSASFSKGPGMFSDVASEAPLYDGRWHRVAVTYSAYDAQVCFYVDGKLVREVSRDGGPLLENRGPVRLAGGFVDHRAKPPKSMAAVSHVEVWNRALSPEEISRLSP